MHRFFIIFFTESLHFTIVKWSNISWDKIFVFFIFIVKQPANHLLQGLFHFTLNVQFKYSLHFCIPFPFSWTSADNKNMYFHGLVSSILSLNINEVLHCLAPLTKISLLFLGNHTGENKHSTVHFKTLLVKMIRIVAFQSFYELFKFWPLTVVPEVKERMNADAKNFFTICLSLAHSLYTIYD